MNRVVVSALGMAAVPLAAGVVASAGGLLRLLWLMAPLAIALAPLSLVGRLARRGRYAVYAFTVTVLALLSFFYVGWAVGFAPASAGPAALRTFVPPYSLLLGGIAALLGASAGTVHEVIIQGRGRRRPAAPRTGRRP